MSGSGGGLASHSDATLMASTLKGFLPGAYVASWLGGMVFAEGARAMFRFPDDPLHLRALVAFTVILTVAYTGVFGQVLYGDIVQNFGNYQHLALLTTEFSFHICISRLALCVPQYFFAHRLWALSRNWWLSVTVLVCATAHLGLSIYIAWIAFDLPDWMTLAKNGKNALRILYALAVATEALTTGGLLYYLRQVQKRAEHNQNVMRKLLIITFETNGATVVLATIGLCALGEIDVGYVYALAYINGQVYLLSLLVSLNSRAGLRESARRHAVLADVQNRRAKNPFIHPLYPDPQPVNPLEGVHVERVVFTDVEADAAAAEKFNHRAPVRVRRDPLAPWLGDATTLG